MNTTTVKPLHVEVTLQAFGNKDFKGRFVRSYEFEAPATYNKGKDSHQDLLANISRHTNLYNGELWDIIEPLLPADRTHTALSVGDKIVIDYFDTYIVAEIGFVKLNHD